MFSGRSGSNKEPAPKPVAGSQPSQAVAGGLGGPNSEAPTANLAGVPILGRRDVTMLTEAISRPDWQLKPEMHAELPGVLWSVITAKRPDGRFVYSDRARLSATNALIKMNGQNQSNAPAPQAVNLTVQADVSVAMQGLDGLSRAELEAVAAAGRLIATVSKPAGEVQ